MKVAITLIVASAVIFAARAQTIPTQTASIPTPTSCLGCFSTTPVPTQSTDYVFINRAVPGNGQNGYSVNDIGALQLKDFAYAGDISALRSESGTGLARLNRKVQRGVALAAATDIQGPVAGKHSRIGGGVTTTEGEVAGAVSFSHQAGNVDVGAAFGFTKGQQLGKASAGFSF